LKIAEITEFLPVFFPKSQILELDCVIEILGIPQNHIVGGYASPLFKWQADWRIFQYRSLALSGDLGGYPVVGGFTGKHVSVAHEHARAEQRPVLEHALLEVPLCSSILEHTRAGLASSNWLGILGYAREFSTILKHDGELVIVEER
jgi:hypothetical protein